MKNVFNICFLVLSVCYSIHAQESQTFLKEFGIDLTPLIAESVGGHAGVELIFRKELKKNRKLRLRYEINQYEPFLADGQVFRAVQLTENEWLVNYHDQQLNHGLYLGIQKGFSINGLKMYGGVDLNGQLNRGTVISRHEFGTERLNPFELFSNLHIEGTAQNRYRNFQVGVQPFLGIDIQISERLTFFMEMGPKLGYRYSKVPYLADFAVIEHQEQSDILIELVPIKDIALMFRF